MTGRWPDLLCAPTSESERLKPLQVGERQESELRERSERTSRTYLERLALTSRMRSGLPERSETLASGQPNIPSVSQLVTCRESHPIFESVAGVWTSFLYMSLRIVQSVLYKRLCGLASSPCLLFSTLVASISMQYQEILKRGSFCQGFLLSLLGTHRYLTVDVCCN